MKVNILSMQRIDNMGSLLQAYALKKMIESLGAEVAFMDIKQSKEDNALSLTECLQFPDEIEYDGVLLKLKKIDKYLFNRFHNKQTNYIQRKLYETFRETDLNIKKTFEFSDLCVIGADEVFNCMNKNEWGFSSQLFGNVNNTGKVITYAASCGATTFESLPQSISYRMMDSFKNISGFSVRDENTKRFVLKLSEKNPQIHLDPVLIYDFSEEIEAVVLPELPKKYCIIYSYGNRIHNRDEIDSILKFCGKEKMTPIALGSPQFWCKYYISCSPFQCLKIFNNSSFVITDTFHGTIFSVKYAKYFAVLTRESNRNKLDDLLERLQISKHKIKMFDEIEISDRFKKDSTRHEAIISKAKKDSYTYLAGYIK